MADPDRSDHDATPDTGDGDAGMPAGPWLLVTGMHRSGTSAVAGVLGALGFQTPTADDRMDWPESNPEHWESLSLTVFDDELMDRLGGSWDAPPDLPDGWETGAAVSAHPDPGPIVAAAFPEPGPLMWKDPRICLLYPYWKRLIPAPVAVVLVWRAPGAVAASLHRRDGMDPALGVALWERYNRSALALLGGVDAFVVSYEHLQVDPRAVVGSVADWLGSLGQFDDLAAGWDLDAALATLTGEAPAVAEGDDAILLEEQRRLAGCLAELDGGHRPLPDNRAGDESPWTTALLRSRRQYRSRELDAVRTRLGLEIAQRQESADYWKGVVETMVDSTSWRVTRPLRSALARVPRTGSAAPGRPGSAPAPGPADRAEP